MAMLNNQMVWPHFLHRLTCPAAQIHRCSTGFLGCRNSTGTMEMGRTPPETEPTPWKNASFKIGD